MLVNYHMCRKRFRNGLIIASLLLVFSQTSQTQAQDSPPTTSVETQSGTTGQDGLVFKSPKGYMRAAFANVKGVLFLDAKKAAGIFVIYQNDGDTTASLRQRVLADIAEMFFHEKDVPAPPWQLKPLTPHTGDNDGDLAYSSAGEMEVQVLTYHRAENSSLFAYGYFAMRHKSGKGDDGKFLDEQGKGVKDFDKLWQSFGGKKK